VKTNSSPHFKIAPSLLSANFANLEAEIAQFDPSLADYLHIDVMDGRFVPNITVGPFIVKAIKEISNIPLDVHLMIVEPEKYIADFVKSGASILTIHAEATDHLQRHLKMIRDLGARAGVSLNPATPLSALDHVWDDLDLILLMTVNPGFGGQKFIPAMKDKIKKCRSMIDTRPIELEIDGGIKLENIREMADLGANVFVSGSGVFDHPPYNDRLKKMREALNASN
jgi:ribulose-phosphate 3-epimerase